MEQPTKLNHDTTIKKLMDILDKAQIERKWGSVQVTFQNGIIKTIREEETHLIENDGRR